MKYFCDGSGFNGRKAEYAVTDADGNILRRKTFNQDYTNNDMEYEAVIYALTIAKDGDTILTDSQLVVNQLTKGWKVKARNLMVKYNHAKDLYENKNISLLWIPRDENLAGKIFE